MGLFDKLLHGADKVYDVKTDIEYGLFRDRRYDAAERLAAGGDPGTAIVTGIRGRFNGDTTDFVYRLEWNDGTAREGAVNFGYAAPPALRIGSSVLVRTDGGDVVLDPERMAGVVTAPRDPGRKQNKVPDIGVDDKALDMRVLRRLDKWRPERATIASWTRSSVLGMATDNWDVAVTRVDGSAAQAARDNIPPYARWFVHPGAEVPVTVDPGDPTKVQVDWPRLAEERAGGTWEDAPPQGSVADDLLMVAASPPVAAASVGASVDLPPPPGAADAIEGVTLEQWALVEASLVQDRVAPADYDSYATGQYGVAAGRWTAIAAAWNLRMQGDWHLGAAFGEAFEAARKDLKKRR